MNVHIVLDLWGQKYCQCAVMEAVALGPAGSEYVHRVCFFAVRTHYSSVSDTHVSVHLYHFPGKCC